MNIEIISLAANLAERYGVPLTSLVPLAALKDVKVADLTVEHVQTVAKALGLGASVTDETVSNVAAVMKAANVDAVADLIRSPEQVELVVKALGLAPPDENLIICPHCSGFIVP